MVDVPEKQSKPNLIGIYNCTIYFQKLDAINLGTLCYVMLSKLD